MSFHLFYSKKIRFSIKNTDVSGLLAPNPRMARTLEAKSEDQTDKKSKRQAKPALRTDRTNRWLRTSRDVRTSDAQPAETWVILIGFDVGSPT